MFSRLIPYIASAIVLTAFAGSYIFAVKYGKETEKMLCEMEKAQNIEDARTEDRATIKQRENAHDEMRDKSRIDIIKHLGAGKSEWLCGSDCEL